MKEEWDTHGYLIHLLKCNEWSEDAAVTLCILMIYHVNISSDYYVYFVWLSKVYLTKWLFKHLKEDIN